MNRLITRLRQLRRPWARCLACRRCEASALAAIDLGETVGLCRSHSSTVIAAWRRRNLEHYLTRLVREGAA